MSDLGLLKFVGGLGQSTVVAVADAAHQRPDTSIGQAFSILDRDILAASIAVMGQPAAMKGPSVVQSLLQRIEHEVGVCRASDSPADDAAGLGIDPEGHVDEACTGRLIGEVGPPQRVRMLRLELPGEVRARCRLVADCGPAIHALASVAPQCSVSLHGPTYLPHSASLNSPDKGGQSNPGINISHGLDTPRGVMTHVNLP